MGFLIGLLTFVMVLDCLVLIFLVLLQLPKKEAGAGLAFGAGATDALFGAGSGTVLTKITKYSATTFFVLAIGLSVMQSNYHRRPTTEFERQLSKPGKSQLPAAPAPAPETAPAPKAAVTANTNTPFTITTQPEATNAPSVTTTNAPAAAQTNPAPAAKP
jgi:preprotein translocase subunit SecG